LGAEGKFGSSAATSSGEGRTEKSRLSTAGGMAGISANWGVFKCKLEAIPTGFEKSTGKNTLSHARYASMPISNLQPLAPPRCTRLDDDDEGEEKECRRKPRMPVCIGIIQKKFLKERKIFLWGAVTDETAKDITERLLYLEAAAPGKEIFFYINTPGGSITAGMAVFDTMKLVTSPIT